MLRPFLCLIIKLLQMLLALARNLFIGTRCKKDSKGEKSAKKRQKKLS